MARTGTVLWRSKQWRYTARAYGYAPVTFVRRVVLGRDPYWRQYFWSRWGYVPDEVLAELRSGPVMWIDALSGGEVLQVVSFCRKLREALPGWRFLLSTNNRYSYDFARRVLAVDAVMDSPWDCQKPVRRALAAVSPLAVVSVENLTAPVLFREARRRGIVTILVSGLMSKNFHLHPMLGRTMQWRPLDWVDWIGVKSEEDARGFITMGARASRVVPTGNMKFDLGFLRVADEERDRQRDDLGLGTADPVFLAASIHPGEERFVGDAFVAARARMPALRLIVVPRYQFHAEAMTHTLASLGLTVVRRTSQRRAGPRDVVMVDTFGELSRLYAVASIVFIGGSTYLRNVVGLGQNIVEPLAQAKPILFGVYMNLWRDITDELKKVWTGVEVTRSEELALGLTELLGNPDLRRRLEEKARAIVNRHRDDVQQNVDLVVTALGSQPKRPDRAC